MIDKSVKIKLFLVVTDESAIMYFYLTINKGSAYSAE